MATNYEKISTKDGLKQFIFDAITYSDGCDLCRKYGFVKFPCKLCLVTVAADKEGEFDKRMDEWLDEEAHHGD